MTIRAEFLDLMPSTVAVYKSQSRDAYGKRTFGGTATMVRCRIQGEVSVVKDPENRDVLTTGKLIMFGTPDVNVHDKVVLPDDTVATIVSVDVVDDEDGPHHTVVNIGR